MLMRDRKAITPLMRSTTFGASAHNTQMSGYFDEGMVRAAGLAFDAYAPEFTQNRIRLRQLRSLERRMLLRLAGRCGPLYNTDSHRIVDGMARAD